MANWLRAAAALRSSGRKTFTQNGNTGCPYFTPVYCTPLSFNAPCQFTPVLCLRPPGLRCIALSLAACHDAADRVRNWRHRTKPRGWTITRSRESSQWTCIRHVVRPRITVVCLFVCICSAILVLLATGTMEYNNVTKTLNSRIHDLKVSDEYHTLPVWQSAWQWIWLSVTAIFKNFSFVFPCII